MLHSVISPSCPTLVETNRVYLQFIRGVDGSDYINASYIDVSRSGQSTTCPVAYLAPPLVAHRATTTSEPSSPLRGPCSAQWSTSGGWSGSITALWSSCSLSSQRREWYAVGCVQSVACIQSNWPTTLQERSARYWPYEVLRSESYGSYTVEMTAERNSGHYVYRDLHITDPEVSFYLCYWTPYSTWLCPHMHSQTLCLCTVWAEEAGSALPVHVVA